MRCYVLRSLIRFRLRINRVMVEGEAVDVNRWSVTNDNVGTLKPTQAEMASAAPNHWVRPFFGVGLSGQPCLCASFFSVPPISQKPPLAKVRRTCDLAYSIARSRRGAKADCLCLTASCDMSQISAKSPKSASSPNHIGQFSSFSVQSRLSSQRIKEHRQRQRPSRIGGLPVSQASMRDCDPF